MRYFLAILLLLYFNALTARRPLQKDSSLVNVRNISVTYYQQQEKFQYKPRIPEARSLWDRLLAVFWDFVNAMFRTESGKTTLKTTVLILSFAVIVFFIVKVNGMNRQILFANTNTAVSYKVSDGNIHAIDFNLEINNAIEQVQYTFAIRLLYLQTLKILNDRALINWLPEKTNTAYIKEMNNQSCGASFRELTVIFEEAWYGQQNITEPEFAKIYSSFKQFHQLL